MLWETEQTKSFAVSWLKSILLYNYGAGNKRRREMSYSRVSLFSLLAKSCILSFTRNIWRKMSFLVKFQFKIRQKCRSKWNDIGHTLELGLKTVSEGSKCSQRLSASPEKKVEWSNNLFGSYNKLNENRVFPKRIFRGCQNAWSHKIFLEIFIFWSKALKIGRFIEEGLFFHMVPSKFV